MPPVLNPGKSKVDGLAFLGLSLTRESDEYGHPDSTTHQTAFDFNQVLDRDYHYVFSTNDDGWLVGGGEPGPPDSYKLAAPDSAHVEIMRIGTFKSMWGGVPLQELVEILASGQILIPQMEVCPTAVVANGDKPPELEIRFDMEADPTGKDGGLPLNWQLRFVHNQLFRHFEFPSRFCPGAFHSTIVRKAEFRSPQHETVFFTKCKAAVEGWKLDGPQPLLPKKLDKSIKDIPTGFPDIHNAEVVDARAYSGMDAFAKCQQQCQSGIYLFTDRNNITHRFLPNFLPPYDTPEKMMIIREVLSEEWNEKELRWEPVEPPMPTTPIARNKEGGDSSMWSSLMDCGMSSTQE